MSCNGVEGHTLHFSFPPYAPLHSIPSHSILSNMLPYILFSQYMLPYIFSIHICSLTFYSLPMLPYFFTHMLPYILFSPYILPYILFSPICPLYFILSNMLPYFSFCPYAPLRSILSICSLTFHSLHICPITFNSLLIYSLTFSPICSLG